MPPLSWYVLELIDGTKSSIWYYESVQDKNVTEAEEKLVDILVGKANDIAERTKAADVWE